MLAHAKRGWMVFVHHLGQVQTAIILSLAYFLVIGPIATLLRAFGRRDLLEIRSRKAASFAHDKQAIPTDRERCERQF